LSYEKFLPRINAIFLIKPLTLCQDLAKDKRKICASLQILIRIIFVEQAVSELANSHLTYDKIFQMSLLLGQP
jgi:hypothetical protein